MGSTRDDSRKRLGSRHASCKSRMSCVTSLEEEEQTIDADATESSYQRLSHERHSKPKVYFHRFERRAWFSMILWCKSFICASNRLKQSRIGLRELERRNSSSSPVNANSHSRVHTVVILAVGNQFLQISDVQNRMLIERQEDKCQKDDESRVLPRQTAESGRSTVELSYRIELVEFPRYVVSLRVEDPCSPNVWHYSR